MTGLYQIISPSGAIYIGQSWDIEQRHRWYKNHNAVEQPRLNNSFKKYGFDSHELKLLHELPNDVTQDVLDNYEIFYIETYKQAGFKMMNLKEGGLGGKHHLDSIAKISKGLKGRKKPSGFGEAMSKRQTGSKHSAERIENMRLSRVGKPVNNPNAGKHCIGKKRSQETKIKISEAQKGRIFSTETKDKMRLARIEWCKNNPQKVMEGILRLAQINKKQ